MTTINNLPEEILLIVFKKLGTPFQKRYQHICRTWYFPAHTLFLNEVQLDGVSVIKLFIDSIDYNPDPAYLKALKSIKIASHESVGPFYFDDKLNQKLFYRFPNLETVMLNEPTFLENFNDEMCKTFLVKCPKLKKFTVENYVLSEPEYRNQVFKAKSLITKLYLQKLEDVSQNGDIVQFLSGFPRLEAITGTEKKIALNFKQLLQILERISDLTTVHMLSDIDCTNAAEEYLKSKPKDEQDTLIKRLADIELELDYKLDFCINSLNFVMKYVPGLCNFFSEDNETWTEAHEERFYHLISELDKFKMLNHMQLNYMQPQILAEYFPIVMQKVRTETLEVLSWVSTDLSISPGFKSVSLSLDEAITVPQIAHYFFTTTFDYLDKFRLIFFERRKSRCNPSYLGDYNRMLSQMPNLEKVEIDVSAEFVDKDDGDSSEIELPLVKDFTIRATSDAQFQSLLNSFYFAFPNLKHLTLFYYSGNWDKDVGEFRIKLQRYTLESLLLDMTPVKTRTINILKKEIDGFFVLEVEALNTDERHLYKISFDLSLVSKLKDGDLIGYIRGRDYFLVSVTIGSLQNLEVVVYDGNYEEGNERYFYRGGLCTVPRVMILENEQWKS